MLSEDFGFPIRQSGPLPPTLARVMERDAEIARLLKMQDAIASALEALGAQAGSVRRRKGGGKTRPKSGKKGGKLSARRKNDGTFEIVENDEDDENYGILADSESR